MNILLQISGEVSMMSKKDWLDPNSQKFHHNWTRPKRTNSQMNGHTEVSLRTRINQSVSNENRFC